MNESTKHVFTFRLQSPHAQNAFLIGDFNNWSTTATAMKCVAPNVWRVDVGLRPGRYRYAFFLLDGSWFDGAPASGAAWIEASGSVVDVPKQPSAHSKSTPQRGRMPAEVLPR